MDGLDDMTVFKATVDHGSASAAGRHLGMPKSTVARRILELETRLGTPLFHRGRQHYVLTSFGKGDVPVDVEIGRQALLTLSR